MGLVLIGAFAPFRRNPSVVELWDGAVSKLTDPIDPKFALDFQQSTLARPIPSAFLDTVVQESLKVPARVWRAALGALLESNISSEIHAIRAPTLIVWGERDTIASRRDQEVLAKGIAGAQLRIYRGDGPCGALGGARAVCFRCDELCRKPWRKAPRAGMIGAGWDGSTSCPFHPGDR